MITRRKTTLLAILVLGLLPIQFSQSGATAINYPTNPAYLFVEIETKVYRKDVEISSANP